MPVLGVLEPGLTYMLFDLGVRRTTASHAALLLALDSPATLGLAVMFLRERIDLSLLTSLVMGLAGSVLVTWHLDTSTRHPTDNLADPAPNSHSLRCDHLRC